jgi:tryptophanyl-tRNA synthetase
MKNYSKEGDTVLTGIKPTGDLHIANYLGAIEPALRAAEQASGQTYFFIADLHALNQEKDPKKLSHYIRSVAAAWLASGLDPEKHVFYRQSDIRPISELTVFLSAVTAKSLMNKAHAYKAARDRNVAEGKDSDSGINMGLYTYPILMAADILGPQANVVPVGQDQVQHIEIAQDIAEAFNRTYCLPNNPCFTVPNYVVSAETNIVPGIDGRKMSKSYGNTIPLFTTPDVWKKVIRKIVTDSSPASGVPHPEESNVFKIFQAVASPEESSRLLEDLKSGKARWSDAKDRLTDAVQKRFGAMSQQYFEWMDSPDRIKSVLERGRKVVEPVAQATLENAREVTGLNF